MRVEFDPAAVTLDELLDRFWSEHDPFHPGGRGQYRPLLLGETPADFEELWASARLLEETTGRRVITEVAQGPFHRAEDDHQKWRLRRRERLYEDLARNYPSEQALLDSVAATKLNAYVGGHGTRDQVERDAERLGLTPDGVAELLASSVAA